MNTETRTPLHIRPEEHDPANPFAGDLFGRRKLADRLTGLIERMGEGCVLAIDAPWGEGKTWFGRNWAADLRAREFGVAYIDAFRQDYADDPFLMVCSEILSEIGDDDGAKGRIVEASRKVARALLPAAAKAALNFGGRFLLGTADLSEDIRKAAEDIDKGIADALEKRLAKRLDEHEADRRSVEGFASVLREHAENREKPLIVIVDELDRCRPDFAVRTIERIKHFFDVPGVIFVILVNRPQIEAAVRGIYGEGVDAGAYLGKFVQFWLRLPKTRTLEATSQDHNQIYCGDLARRFGLATKGGHRGFQEAFGALATLTGLSLRDLERGYTLFSLAQPIDNAGSFAAWVVYLKLAHPEIHAGLLSGDPAGHVESRKILATLISRSKSFWMLPILDDLHRFLAEGGKNPLGEEAKGVLSTMGMWGIQPERFLPWLCERMDLNVE
ncbi:MAG: KAP family NTPase [Rhodocyclales bacterium]|nr:KAP family NTPase [Rhodocyclales bacterium]